MDKNKYCKDCKLFDSSNNLCQRYHSATAPHNLACKHYTEEETNIPPAPPTEPATSTNTMQASTSGQKSNKKDSAFAIRYVIIGLTILSMFIFLNRGCRHRSYDHSTSGNTQEEQMYAPTYDNTTPMQEEYSDEESSNLGDPYDPSALEENNNETYTPSEEEYSDDGSTESSEESSDESSSYEETPSPEM